MKHLIMGTAGHIDHGKTTLIKMLTGHDCDTHKEEKNRGITIQLGFTHYKLSEEEKIGIIDVPGHADFVNTMVAGAAGIDFVMLVIAADAGIMPQTEEHLSIMKILGIKKGLIVITKADLVEPEYLELVEDEVKDFASGTFLENSPVISFSAVTGKGIDEIKYAVNDITAQIEPKVSMELFRMYIDRLFTVRGKGTVAAGTVRSGKINKSGKIYLFPGYKPVRVRKMERYGEEVDELVTGDRGSLNITGINREEVARGMLLSDGIIQGTDKIDAKLTLFSQEAKLKTWSQCLFLHGAQQYEVRIHLLDADTLSPGKSAIVQIHFSKPFYACYGDRFVIRNSSSDLTLGGGRIIDVRPLHHRKRTKRLLSNLQKIVSGKQEELIASEVRKTMDIVTLAELKSLFNISEDELKTIITADLPEDIVALTAGETVYLTEKVRYEKLRRKIERHLKTYHKNNPLEEYGRTFEELLGLFGKERSDKLEKYMKIVLDKLTEEQKLKRAGNTWISAAHKVVLSDKLREEVAFIEKSMKDYQMRVPLMSQLLPAAEKRGIDKQLLLQILNLLVNRGKAYRIENNYIHSTIVDYCRMKLLKALQNNNEGMTIAQFRDLVEGNRKICLLLQGLYDSEGVTLRKGDYRVITAKGKKFIEERSV